MAKNVIKSSDLVITLPDAVDLIRFEKNLLQIGFFGAHERRGKQVSSSRRIEQWVNRDGRKIKVSAEFRSSEALGLPSTSDRDKYMAFMKLAMETRLRNGVVTNPIRFSGYSLLNALGQCDSGENYEALNSWGMRMADTTITSEQVIYSSVRKRYMNKTVHVFRSFTRLGGSSLDGSGRTDVYEIELEDWLLENLNESFVVPEDFNMYRKLVRPTAKGIFVYLYLWFFASQGKEVEKDYGELCALLNVRTYDHVSKIRETMGLSLTDLVTIGYLKSWDIRPMSSKVGYKLVLSLGHALKDVLLLTQRKQLVSGGNQARPALTVEREKARLQLINAGVNPTKAAQLASKLDPLGLLDRIEYVAAQVQQDRRRSIKNPAGYLITFTEAEQPLPSSFQTSREKESQHNLMLAEQAQEDLRQEKALLEMQLEQEYDRWSFARVDEHLASNLSNDDVRARLKGLSNQLRKDSATATSFDRMTPEVRNAQLLRLLKKEIRGELFLPKLEDWIKANPQGALF